VSTIENIAPKAKQKLLTEVRAFPAVAIKALQIISRERGQLQELSDVIASDAAISGGILRMANSALFGVRIQISGVLQAIHMLGLERIKGVVATIAMKSYLGNSLEIPALRDCWRHSLACGISAEEFAKASLMEADVAYTAGLMHDVGRLALIATYPNEYAAFLSATSAGTCEILQGERDLFGVDHCHAGMLLVTRWNLPKMFAEVTSRHHDAATAGDSAMLSTVRRSCRMAHALGFSVGQSHSSATYEQILSDLPEREQSRFPLQSVDLAHHIASKINSIESV
jgi:HD-like signal output (HDOD) protein